MDNPHELRQVTATAFFRTDLLNEAQPMLDECVGLLSPIDTPPPGVEVQSRAGLFQEDDWRGSDHLLKTQVIKTRREALFQKVWVRLPLRPAHGPQSDSLV